MVQSHKHASLAVCLLHVQLGRGADLIVRVAAKLDTGATVVIGARGADGQHNDKARHEEGEG